MGTHRNTIHHQVLRRSLESTPYKVGQFRAAGNSVQIEVSPDEGHAGATPEQIPSPPLAAFGLPTPDHLTILSMRYQIAQKVHASTDPHDPPAFVNDRARDVVDLLLLRDLIDANGHPTLAEVRSAVEDASPPVPSKQWRPAHHRVSGGRGLPRIPTGGRVSPRLPNPPG